jgi:hypothetical protein
VGIDPGTTGTRVFFGGEEDDDIVYLADETGPSGTFDRGAYNVLGRAGPDVFLVDADRKSAADNAPFVTRSGLTGQ